MNRAYLCIDADYLSHAKGFRSVTAACAAYLDTARELDRYGQRCEAAIHLAPDRASLAEYPDYVLSLGPRGGLKKERA